MRSQPSGQAFRGGFLQKTDSSFAKRQPSRRRPRRLTRMTLRKTGMLAHGVLSVQLLDEPAFNRRALCRLAERLFVGRGAVDRRNGDSVQTQVDPELCAVMDDVVHHEAAKHSDARHGEEGLAAGEKRPLLH